VGGKAIRLGRLHRRGRALIVAIDHGLFAGPLRGIEDPRIIVKVAREGGADAIMATPPVVEYVSTELGDLLVVARVDGGSTVLGPDPTRNMVVYSVREAVWAGADAVVAFGYVGASNEPEQLAKLATVARECRELGVPLIAEMLPAEMVAYHHRGGEGAVKPESIALAARVAWELGADAIKTYYTGDPESFRKVVGGCPIPIYVLGGPAVSDFLAFLKQVEGAMSAGARGAVVGRNVWQHPDPLRAVEALSAVVHKEISAEEAARRAGLA
jgi:fructose-bisphosphate aldolase/2-amino-3,7-dideoxy-D-threo-hept-6-ulosonate synthase